MNVKENKKYETRKIAITIGVTPRRYKPAEKLTEQCDIHVKLRVTQDNVLPHTDELIKRESVDGGTHKPLSMVLLSDRTCDAKS